LPGIAPSERKHVLWQLFESIEIRGRDVLRSELALELVILYADLLATKYGIDLSTAIVEKFNAVSELQGFPERLGSIPARERVRVIDVCGPGVVGVRTCLADTGSMLPLSSHFRVGAPGIEPGTSRV